ncbi:hypothetical protein FRZ03_13795 [Streptomyces misionensis]|uniref:Uncharacterized protein n=1 Tax=Streptomyces misionensis TaxID=67331 RepID=A0A5C6JU58_9ACTN|nr:hypothetical protein [Streptomyces misionensis]TWV47500.1 hypothetical protein FRZ03_13795 [Streptomyces misionensis]
MFLTGAPTTMPDLSCYTTNLLARLAPDIPEVRRRLARGVRLAVRTDLPAGELAFSHHPRIDTTDDGRQLAYAGTRDWSTAREALHLALLQHRRVLAVANTRHLPWSPAQGLADAPHWVLLEDRRDGQWLVADHFSALTPNGMQRPYLGWIGDAELATALAPWTQPPQEVARRDVLALGEESTIPPADHYRWLDWAPATDCGATPGTGTWVLDLDMSLRHTCEVLRANPAAVARYVDDLWAAARHHTFKLALDAADGNTDPARAAVASAAWDELPRAVRFAAQSTARGRPRPGAIERSVDQLLTALRDLPAPDKE